MKLRSTARISFPLTATIAALLAATPPQAHAIVYHWDANAGDSGTGGSGIWDTSSALWRSGGATGTLSLWPNTSPNGDEARLTSTAGTVTLNADSVDINVNIIRFGSAGNIIAAPTSGTAKLVLSGNNPTIAIGGNGGTILADISGTSLTKTGASTLILGGNNTFGSGTMTFGATNVNNGYIRLTSNKALGDYTNITLTSSGAAVNGLEVAGGVNAAYNILTGGRGNQTTIGYALKNVSGDNTWSGNITASAAGGGYGILSDAGTLTISGGISATSVTGIRTFEFAGAGDFSIGGSISDGSATLAVAKDGAGTLTITSNSNSYTGATIVSGGKLVINGNISTSTLTTVNNGATLGGNGSVGALTVASGGTLAPGNSIESLGAGNVSFAEDSTFAYEFNSASLNGDLLHSTGTLDITPGTILTLTQEASGSLAIGSKLTLISYFGGWTGSELFTYLGGTLNDGAQFTLGSNEWQFDYDDLSGGSNFIADQSGATRFVTMTVVPEPNVAALLGGLGVLGLLRRRR